MGSDLASLMAVRMQGFASPERTADMLVCEVSVARATLDDLLARELVKERTGALTGISLTADGVAAMDQLLAAEGLRASEDLTTCYERFMTVDPLVKQACSTAHGSFDDGLDQLERAHDKARACIRKISRCAERYATYGTRLDACMRRLQDGDRAAFTTPLAESYHQVWWELHTDLATTLDIEKEA